ncbi:MAG: dihydroorotase, partial [Bacteroidota bacterium]|nr:dihydroorotase [Bacteroidota bacterium]
FCGGPKNIMGLENIEIKKGMEADLTLFDPGVEWTYEGSVHSLSKNDAFKGSHFTGRVVGTYAKGQLMIN